MDIDVEAYNFDANGANQLGRGARFSNTRGYIEEGFVTIRAESNSRTKKPTRKRADKGGDSRE